jgi:cysteinyl-tRNA synthetase
MPFQLYNTITRSLEAFTPADPGRISFYTCGPTVYDDAHIGNFRSFLAADVLRRWLESPLCEIEGDTRTSEQKALGRTVVHVMNITDVGHMTDDAAADGGGEDKMAIAGQRLAAAKKAGKIPADADIDPNDPVAIADFFADRFMDDAQMLGLKVASDAKKDPSLMPRATANIDGMQRLIAALIERGHAYVTGEAGARAVYFSVASFPSYGKLSGNTLDKLRGGAGGRVSNETQQQKKHPADFLLWKEDAAHLMKWDSPWGTGYPGWHIECSVMALDRLVPGGLARVLGKPDASLAIDLHSGGEDNIFPHHECERAQSCCVLGGDRFARFWFHARFLMVDGAKMSKSRGTMYTARQLFEMGHEPAAVRLELIKAHYRTNADFGLQGLKDSAKMVERWRRFAERAKGGPKDASASDTAAVRSAFAAAMADDLNIAEAIGIINKWINETPEPGGADAALMAAFDAVLGLLALPRLETKAEGLAVYLPGTTPSEAVGALLAERATAKKDKDFAKADAIRDELAQMGYAIKDIAGGKVEVSPAS